MKQTYINSVNKHRIRDNMFNMYKSYYPDNQGIIGLAGPDINEYINTVKSYNFDNITIYENNKETFLKQLTYLNDYNIAYRFENINNTSLNKEYFYDLDYCCTIRNTNKELINNLDNYMLTVCVRGIGLKSTLEEYFNMPFNIQLNVIRHQKELTIFKRNYMYVISYYHDVQAMLTILKIKIK